MSEYAKTPLYDVIAELCNGRQVRLHDSVTKEEARATFKKLSLELANSQVIQDELDTHAIVTAYVSQIFIKPRTDPYATELGDVRTMPAAENMPIEITYRCPDCEHDRFWNSGASRDDPTEFTCLNCGKVIRTTDDEFDDNTL